MRKFRRNTKNQMTHNNNLKILFALVLVASVLLGNRDKDQPKINLTQQKDIGITSLALNARSETRYPISSAARSNGLAELNAHLIKPDYKKKDSASDPQLQVKAALAKDLD